MTTLDEKKIKYTCTKCGKTLAATNFFTHKDKTKFPMCKKCTTMHVDNFNSETYDWILKEADVPYIPAEWESLILREKQKKPGEPLKPDSIVGKYISKMKLKNFLALGYADGEKIRAENAEKAEGVKETLKIREEAAKEKFENGEISEAQYKTEISVATLEAEDRQKRLLASEEFRHSGGKILGYGGDFVPGDVRAAAARFGESNDDIIVTRAEIDALYGELAKEDATYLAMKWGMNYSVPEWVQMEKHYMEMEEAFDIQDPDTKMALVGICKIYVQMNSALDMKDMDSFGKLSSAYNAMRKTANFTASQKKEGNTQTIDAIGSLVHLCEKDGFIPKFDLSFPQDKVDMTILDMKRYHETLVKDDLGFAGQLEATLDKLLKMVEDKEQGIEEGQNPLDLFYEKEPEDMTVDAMLQIDSELDMARGHDARLGSDDDDEEDY